MNVVLVFAERPICCLVVVQIVHFDSRSRVGVGIVAAGIVVMIILIVQVMISVINGTAADCNLFESVHIILLHFHVAHRVPSQHGRGIAYLLIFL